MTVASNTPFDQYSASNGQTVFNYTFEIVENTDLLVYQRADGSDPDDVADLLLLTVDYTVTGVGADNGGTIVLVSGAALDDIITIKQNVPVERDTSFTPGGVLKAGDLNAEFDNQTLQQQLTRFNEQMRMLRYWNSAVVIPLVDNIIPVLPAGTTWWKNDANDAIESYILPAGGAAPLVGTFVTILDESGLMPNSFPLANMGSAFMANRVLTGDIVARTLLGTVNELDITNGDGQAGNPVFKIADNPSLPGTEYFFPPIGNTAQRPTVPAEGMVRYNTDVGALEVYESTFWDPLSGGVVDLVSGFLNQITVDNTDQANPIVHIANNPVIPGLAGITLPSGTTAQRGGNLGTIRFNSQTLEFEGTTDGIAWNTFQTSAGTVLSVNGTANQINSTGGANPVLSLSATTNMPGTFNIQSTTAINAIINDSTMATASATNVSTSSAIKAYVDALVTGLNIQGSCVCASTTALTVTYANGASGVGATLTNAGVQAAISLDGVSPTVGQRVLIKNQASTLQNGIYTVTTVGSGATNWVLTRATDYDSPSEIQPGDLVILTGGSTQNQSSWVQTATVAAVGTDAIAFVQFTASLPVGVASGGTGKTSLTAYAIMAGGTTSTGIMQQLGLGSTGQMLQSQGASALAAFSTATYPSVATGTGTILRANGTNWLATTTTWPTTSTINRILFSSANNVIGEISAQASSVLISDSGSIPLFSTALPAGVQANINAIGTLTTNVRLQSGLALQTDVSAGNTLLIQAYDVDGASYTTFGTLTANNTPTFDLSTAVTIGGNAIGVITPWVAYTPTFNGFGTPTTIQIFSRRVGGSLQIRGNFTCGTSTAAEARMTIGFNGTNANVTSSTTLVPAITTCGSGNSTFGFAGALMPLVESAVQYITFGLLQATGNGLTKRNGDAFTAAATIVSVLVDIPIQGW